jgi:hypothetical protein
VLLDQPAAAGGYCRVHLRPKRFPAAYAVDWRSRVLHEGPDCVVVDKPPGVQVRGRAEAAACRGARPSPVAAARLAACMWCRYGQPAGCALPPAPDPRPTPWQVSPTVDNVLESVAACAAAAVGAPPGSLTGLHRLDAGTSGVVVLGKGDPGFARWFSGLLEGKALGAAGGRPRRGRTRLRAAAAAAAEEEDTARPAPQEQQQGGPEAEQAQQQAQPSGQQQEAEQAAADALEQRRRQAERYPPPGPLVQKVYRAATLRRPPLGPLVDWAEVGRRAPGEPAHTLVVDGPREGALYCELEVLQARGAGQVCAGLGRAAVFRRQARTLQLPPLASSAPPSASGRRPDPRPRLPPPAPAPAPPLAPPPAAGRSRGLRWPAPPRASGARARGR